MNTVLVSYVYISGTGQEIHGQFSALIEGDEPTPDELDTFHAEIMYQNPQAKRVYIENVA